jgi:predicted Co/Zn/Cd cation transporter (cation efflux family)
MNDKNVIEEKVLIKLTVGAFLLALWGIVMAIASDAGVILLDGVFNLISAIMSFFSIEILRLVSGKEGREYPLGYLLSNRYSSSSKGPRLWFCSSWLSIHASGH